MADRIQISKNFFLDEYVTRAFYRKWGERCIYWIRPEVIRIDQFLRDRFHIRIIINDWWHGGTREQSGLRYPYSNVGAGDSLHKFGCASDKVFFEKDPEFYAEVRRDIVRHFDAIYKPLGLTTIEAGTETWLHTDIRHIPDQKQINIVYP
ncbi:MAG: hypothetical protein JXQ80_12180 [Bacteroidales bacterium]|nr:hypothetical protein [Bacteroidales bacterium]